MAFRPEPLYTAELANYVNDDPILSFTQANFVEFRFPVAQQ